MKRIAAVIALLSLAALIAIPATLAGKETGKKGQKDKEKKEKKGDPVLFLLNTNEPSSGGGYITIISDAAGTTFIPIFIGSAEGQAIDRAVARDRPERPLTHDLIASLITELGGDVKSLTISDLKDNTYIGTLTIQQGKKKHEIDCRPSDGLAIALRMAADIKVAEKVVTQAGMTQQQMIQQGYPVKVKSGSGTKSF
jgi:bifunctional DNase/RNase